jgi:hypothetical protein
MEVGFLLVYFSRGDIHRTTFVRNVSQMSAWIPDNKKR